MANVRKLRPLTPEKVYLEALGKGGHDTYRRVLDTIALKRRNPKMTLSKAAKLSGTTLRAILRHAPQVLEIRSGRLDVKATDHLVRSVRMLTTQGEVIIQTKNSRTASRIARHQSAVRASRNDVTALRPFIGKSIRSNGQVYYFETDSAALRRLDRSGGSHFLDIYASPEDAS